jgi:hypothetical protein
MISPVKSAAPVEYSDDILDIGSPSFRSIKRRKSAMGSASRVKTPSKADKNLKDVGSPSEFLPPCSKNSQVSTSRNSLGSCSFESQILKPHDSNSCERRWCVDDFTLGRPIGKGKFGNVYVAKQKETHYPVALKVLFKSQVLNFGSSVMLRREVEIQSKLHHKNILSLFGSVVQKYVYFSDSFCIL